MAAQALLSPTEKLVEDNRGMPGGVCTVYLKWKSATGGGFVYTLPTLSGRITQLITKPDGTAAPTQDYNVTLISAKSGVDLLLGQGADRHTSSTEHAMILKEETINARYYASPPYIDEAGAVFTIDSAGDEKIGEAWIILE